MAREVDVFVIGAGIMGLASAYYIKEQNPGLDVLVVDRNPGPGQGNTARSAAMVRNTFTSVTNQTLTDSSIEHMRDVQQQRCVDIGLELFGYLWLMSQRQLDRAGPAVRLMQKNEIAIEQVDAARLRQLPGFVGDFDAGDEEARIMGLEPVVGGLLGHKCGAVDPDKLCRFYESEFLRIGGKTAYGFDVEELILEPKVPLGIPGEPLVWQEKRVVGARLNGKKEVRAKATVVATGAWANQLMDPVGIDTRMKPKKRQLFAFPAHAPGLEALLDAGGFSDLRCCPFIILPKSGVYIKPLKGERSFWIGCSDDLGRGYSLEDDPKPEEDFYTYHMAPILTKFFPAFSGLRPSRMWAGSYAYSTTDRTPIVFEDSSTIVATGFSGSGIMKADAIGRIVAGLYANRVRGDGPKEVPLFGGRSIGVDTLSLKDRAVEREKFVI